MSPVIIKETGRKSPRRVGAWELFGCLLLCLVLLAGGSLLLLPRRLRIEHFGAVSVGMTQREVEALLGGPPGNYGSPYTQERSMTLEGIGGPPGSIERNWCDDGNLLEIYFDRSDRVVFKHKRAGYSQKGLWDTLLEKAGLRPKGLLL